MDYNKIGRIRPAYVGEWVSSKAYGALDIVKTVNGSMSYIAQKDVPAGTPLSNSSYWALVLDVQNTLNAVDAAIQRTNEQTDNAVARADAAVGRVDNAMDGKISSLTASVSGNPVRIRAEEHSTIKPLLTFRPVQSGSGDPSPENVRPITGRTGAVLTRCGENLLNVPSVININSETSIESRVFEIPLHIPAGTYTFSIDGYAPDNNGQMELVFYYTLETWEEVYPNAFTDKHNTPWSFTFTSDKPIRHCAVYVRAGDDTYTVKNARLELGSTASAYEPYHGDTFTLNFGQTVYGGTLDWNKGELVVDTGFAAFDGSENWVVFTYADGRQSFYTSGTGKLSGIANTYIYIPGICSCAPTADGYIVGVQRTDVGSVEIEIPADTLSKWGIGDLDVLKAKLAANPMQIAYKLANPITIQLTPDYISALFGEWTYYSDADQMTVNYNLDLLEILEKNEDAHREKANGLKSSITGNPVQIYPDEGSIIKPVLTLLPVQSGSGEPSPSNIRPITGWTGTELVRCGKNLVGCSVPSASSGLTITTEKNGFRISGTSTAVYYRTLFTGGILPAGTYTLSVRFKGSTTTNGGINVFCTAGIQHNVWENGTLDGVYSKTFTLTEDVEVFSVNVACDSGMTLDVVVAEIQIELGSTASAYEPYHGDTFTLNFGQTIYGGTLDWNKGEMVVDWAKVTLPSSANWVKSISAKNGYYLGDGNIFVPQKLYMCPVLCNVAKYTPDVEEYKANYGMVYSDSTISLNVDPEVCGSTLESFKSWLDSTEVQIAYKLANPITIRLTPQQITALAGLNTVCGDADEMTVNYNKDLTVAYKELMDRFAAIESAMVNDI